MFGNDACPLEQAQSARAAASVTPEAGKHSRCIPQLLVSVRSAEEAETALRAGADLIDVKEPSRGALGRADDAVIEAVIRVVAGRRPVSAALGEAADGGRHCFSKPGLLYAKWGLAGALTLRRDWTGQAAQAYLESLPYPPQCSGVLVAYADWERAAAPPPEVIAELARRCGCQVFLLDSFVKDGSTLLDWLPVHRIAALVRLCHNSGMRVALAGSLRTEQIVQLREVGPDWFGVRGAACHGGRAGLIDGKRVRKLVELIQGLPGSS